MRRIFVIGLLLVGAVVAFSRGGNVTHAEQWEKVLAPKGVFGDDLLWHDYGAFGLYRVSAETVSALPPAIRATIQTSTQLDTLNLNVQSFNTQSDPIDLPASRGATTATGHKLSLVQFVGPIKQAWLDELIAGGIRPIHYVSQNAYLVWADEAGRTNLQAQSRRAETIQYVVDYLPTFKLDDTLRQRSQLRTAIPVTVQMIQHPDDKTTKRLITQQIGRDVQWDAILQFQNAELTLSTAEIDQLLQQPDVFWIGERLPRVLYDEVQAQLIAGNFDGTQAGPANTGYLAWLDALGFSQNPADYPIVDIVDDGIGDGTTTNGAGDVTLTALGDGTTSRLAYVANCTAATSGEGEDGHGHININIAGGYDQRAGFPFRDLLGYQRGQGVNPYGRFAGTRIFAPNFSLSNCGNSDTALLKSQQDNGAVISSNSWGSDVGGSYDSAAQAFDVAVRDADLSETGNQALITLVAAGNQGGNAATVGSPGTAKNVITVGASESARPSDDDGSWLDGCGSGADDADDAMDVVGFSSRGPAEGNRVKPDVIAPGTHVQGTASTNADYTGLGVCDQYRPSGQTIFAASSGTSHSTPAVAGLTSLYYYWLENQYGLTPSPAMMKAYLIAHPTYLTGVSANDSLPSNAQGYGMPNMSIAFDNSQRKLFDQTTIFDNAGETWSFSGGIADGTKPVRIVLTWTDAPGALSGDPDVNNLNLEVSVDGVVYRGNVFDGAWSVAGGSFDTANNVEAIFLPAGTVGQIVVTVTAANVAGDGVPNSGDATDQDFALVCYNCSDTPDFTLLADPAMLESCIADDAIFNLAVGSIENFADPVTLAALLPANATGSFTTNPVTPVGDSQLTLGTQNMTAGVYAIPVVGTASSGQHTTTVTLALDASATAAPTLQVPAHNSIDQSLLPTLAWTDTGANRYVVELATDAAFTTIVQTATVAATSYKIPTQLGTNVRYYWRVHGINGCGESETSAEFTFRTANIACNLYTSSDVPLSIPTDAATIISTLDIADSGEILDVNVRNLSGTHSYISDLSFSVTSPLGTEVDLFGAICSSENDFAVDLDDEAASSTLPCPPTDGNAYRPIDPLSNFDGESLTGEWSLTVIDSDSFDGGSLNSWGLEICATVPAPAADFNLSIAPNSAEMCLPNSTTHTVQIEQISEFNESVTLAATSLPTGVSAEFGESTIMNSTLLTLTATASATAGNYLLEISGSAPTATHTMTLPLTLAAAPPASTQLTAPASNATEVSTTPTFTWDSSVGAASYLFELATEPTFANPITSTTVVATQFALNHELALGELYYWRVTPHNACGTSDAAVGSFVTRPGTLTCGDTVQFESGIPTDWEVIGVGGLNWVRSNSPECNNLGNQTRGDGLAACVNRDARGAGSFPYNSILTTNPFDLSATQAATLTVKTYYRDYGFNPSDGFAIEAFNGTQWVTVLNRMGTTIDGENLSFSLALNTTQLRFRYFGNDWDYYAQVDDVQLSCIAAGGPTVVGLESAEISLPATPILAFPLIVGLLLLTFCAWNRPSPPKNHSS